MARAALDQHGALVLSVALEAVDDTVLLSKTVLAEMSAELASLAVHAHGKLPLLQVLAPRSSRYLTPAQFSIMGDAHSAASKKEPAQRRAELLVHLLPELLRLIVAHPVRLACSAHGSAVAFEALRLALSGESGLALGDSDSLQGLSQTALEALAAVATQPPPAEAAAPDGSVATAILVHHYGARLFKRLCQAHSTFAEALLKALKGKLERWALAGAGWVILTLVEGKVTSEAASNELQKARVALAGSSAAGCSRLALALSSASGEKSSPRDSAPSKKRKKSKA